MQRKGEEKTMIKKAFAIGLALTMSVTSPMPVMADENMETQESVFDDSGDMDSIEEENSSEEQNGVNEFSSGDVNDEFEQDEQTDSEQEWSSGAEEDTFSATSDVSDFDYSIDGVTGTVTIKGYKGTDSVVYIPQTIEGYTVTSIGGFEDNDIITKVVVPDGVEKILSSCFYECDNLTEVILPDSITEIGDFCFEKCKSLNQINMPSNLEYLGENAFYETISLRKVSFSEGLKNIYRYTFAESGIEEVSLPDSLEYIGYGAFENTNLKKVVIPEKVESLYQAGGDAVFTGCEQLEWVEIKGNTSLEYYEFEGCKNLKVIIFRNSQNSIRGEYITDNAAIYGISNSTAYTFAQWNGNSFYPINAPQNCKAEKADDTTIQLSWDAVGKGMQYKIYRSSAENGEYSLITTTGENQYVDTGLNQDGKYFYKICVSYNVSGTVIDGLQSGVIVGKLSVKPDTPKLNAVQKDGYNRLKVTWSKVSDATGYRIYRKTSATGKFTTLATVKNVSSYTDKKAVGGKTYFYTVRAYTTIGNKTIWGDYDAKGTSGKAQKQYKDLLMECGGHYESFDITGDGINDKFYAKYTVSGRSNVLTVYINSKKSGTIKVTDPARGKYKLELCTLSSNTKYVYLSVRYESNDNDAEYLHKLYKCKTGKISSVLDVHKALKIGSMQSSTVDYVSSNGIAFRAGGITSSGLRRERWTYVMKNGKLTFSKKCKI